MNRSTEGSFYGWWLALWLLIIYFACVGVATSIPPVLYPLQIKALGVTEAQISLCGALALFASGILSPYGGSLVDRFGPRRMLRVGVLIMVVASAVFTSADSLWQLYLANALFGVALVFCGLLPVVVILSNWFIRHRGLVVGGVLAGSSLSGAVLPNLTAWVAADLDLGWRAGLGLPSAGLWLLAVPLVFWAIWEKPADRGQFPDGHQPVEALTGAETAARSKPARGAYLARPAFWLLALSMAALWFAIFSYHNQMVIFVHLDLGFTQPQAAFCLSLIYLASVSGNLLFSALSDRIGTRVTVVLTALLLASGNMLMYHYWGGFRLTASLERLWLFACLFGLGYGGTFSLLQLLVADLFDHRQLGRVLGAVTFIGCAGGFSGTVASGWLRTATGSYLTSFLLVALTGWLLVVMVWLVPNNGSARN